MLFIACPGRAAGLRAPAAFALTRATCLSLGLSTFASRAAPALLRAAAARARLEADAVLRGRAGDGGAGEDAEFGDEDGYQPALLQKPYTRDGGWQEKEAPQKWVQCANCSLWRKARIRAPVTAVAPSLYVFSGHGGLRCSQTFCCRFQFLKIASG